MNRKLDVFAERCVDNFITTISKADGDSNKEEDLKQALITVLTEADMKFYYEVQKAKANPFRIGCNANIRKSMTVISGLYVGLAILMIDSDIVSINPIDDVWDGSYPFLGVKGKTSFIGYFNSSDFSKQAAGIRKKALIEHYTIAVNSFYTEIRKMILRIVKSEKKKARWVKDITEAFESLIFENQETSSPKLMKNAICGIFNIFFAGVPEECKIAAGNFRIKQRKVA